MKQPILNWKQKRQKPNQKWNGINSAAPFDETSFREAQNLSGRLSPYIAARPGRKKIGTLSGSGTISGILSGTFFDEDELDLTFVRNGKLWYRGTEIEMDPYLGQAMTEGEKQLVDFEGKILIFPDCLYYDYVAAETDATVKVRKMENELEANFAVWVADIEGDIMAIGFNKNLLSDHDRERVCRMLTEMRVGDFLIIKNRSTSASVKTMLNIEERDIRFARSTDWVQCEVKQVTATNAMMYLRVLIKKEDGTIVTFESPTSGIATITRHIPSVTHAIGINNRLWLVNGHKLFVSADGNGMSFNQFQELGSDSFYRLIADRGGNFVATGTVDGHVILFKESTMYEVKGVNTNSYFISATMDQGCIAPETIRNIDGKLYFLGQDGVYSYGNNKLVCRSKTLNRTFTGGIAETDGRRYYLYATTDQNTKELWVYDTTSDTWYQENSMEMAYLMRSGSHVYAVQQDGSLYRLDGGTETVSWQFVTHPFTDGSNLQYPTELFLRFQAKLGSTLSVRIKTDRQTQFFPCAQIVCDGRKRQVGTTFFVEEGIEHVTVPIHTGPCDSYELEVSGEGETVIYYMERRFYTP